MSKRKLELIDALKTYDTVLSEIRALLENHARGRRYRELSELASRVVVEAKAAQSNLDELNKILDQEWAASRREKGG